MVAQPDLVAPGSTRRPRPTGRLPALADLDPVADGGPRRVNCPDRELEDPVGAPHERHQPRPRAEPPVHGSDDPNPVGHVFYIDSNVVNGVPNDPGFLGDSGIPAEAGHYSLHPAPGVAFMIQVSFRPAK